jgi:competence protein ComEC
VVALTHADHDHLDGLHAVLDNFRVGALWIGRDDERPAFKRLLAHAHSRRVPIMPEAEGAEFDWHGVRTDVLWPPNAEPAESSNDSSLVLRLSDGDVHFLLTGDIERHTEERLVGAHAPLAADFLKVPHHGSKTSSTEALLAAVAPRVAAVSVGEANSFGHPSEDVIERYEHSGVRLLRTDRDGAVTAVTDGQNLSVHSYAEK